jgi:signal transduction histidine kinase
MTAFVAREQSFTRDASHELRTPLSVMRSTTAQALDDPALTPESRHLLGLAHRSTVRMQQIVASLLALTREDDARRPAVPCLLLPVLEAVIVEQAAALDAANLSLDIDVPRDATLSATPAVLHLVLTNLLGNSIAHAAHGPVRLRVADGVLAVSNPVDAQHTPPLARLGSPGVKRDASPGDGLGLSIVRRLGERSGFTVAWQTADGAFCVSIRHITHSAAVRTSR